MVLNRWLLVGIQVRVSRFFCNISIFFEPCCLLPWYLYPSMHTQLVLEIPLHNFWAVLNSRWLFMAIYLLVSYLNPRHFIHLLTVAGQTLESPYIFMILHSSLWYSSLVVSHLHVHFFLFNHWNTTPRTYSVINLMLSWPRFSWPYCCNAWTISGICCKKGVSYLSCIVVI